MLVPGHVERTGAGCPRPFFGLSTTGTVGSEGRSPPGRKRGNMKWLQELGFFRCCLSPTPVHRGRIFQGRSGGPLKAGAPSEAEDRAAMLKRPPPVGRRAVPSHGTVRPARRRRSSPTGHNSSVRPPRLLDTVPGGLVAKVRQLTFGNVRTQATVGLPIPCREAAPPRQVMAAINGQPKPARRVPVRASPKPTRPPAGQRCGPR